MTRRHEQVAHSRKLGEIRNIMSSMKTLAIMETHKLERSLAKQTKLSETIEDMAADFLYFHQYVLPEATPLLNTVVLLGSERGFCGNYNEKLVQWLESSLTGLRPSDTGLIAVGTKLHPLLKKTGYRVELLKGATVTEDVFSVAGELITRLGKYPQPSSLYVLHHIEEHNDLILEKLLPPFTGQDRERINYSNPPLLNLTDRDFFLELTDHYLLNALHQSLYVSLLMENQQRIQHLENATHHLDDKMDELKRKINALRQEEIIEEIEVILLNTRSDD